MNQIIGAIKNKIEENKGNRLVQGLFILLLILILCSFSVMIL